MQLGVISDIHANLPALGAVLEDMPDVARLVCLGDIVGYYPWPQACVDRVRDCVDQSLKGNHDRYVFRPASAEMNEAAIAGLEYAADNLEEDAKHWLHSLYDAGTVAETDLYAAHSHPERSSRVVRRSAADDLQLAQATRRCRVA